MNIIVHYINVSFVDGFPIPNRPQWPKSKEDEIANFYANRVNEGGLVVIIDELGARCLDFVPVSVKRAGYLIENFGDVTVCQKIFRQTVQTQVIQIVEHDLEVIEIDSVACQGMRRSIGPFGRIKPTDYNEARSLEQRKPRYARQGEVDHFHHARQAEELAAVTN